MVFALSFPTAEASNTHTVVMDLQPGVISSCRAPRPLYMCIVVLPQQLQLVLLRVLHLPAYLHVESAVMPHNHIYVCCCVSRQLQLVLLRVLHLSAQLHVESAVMPHKSSTTPFPRRNNIKRSCAA